MKKGKGKREKGKVRQKELLPSPFSHLPSLTLALSGGLGSGKSSALAAFKKLGAATFDCDAIAREMTQGRGPWSAKVARLLGPQLLDNKGRLDRAGVARIVFNNPAKRRALEKLLHPGIISELLNRLEKNKNPLRVAEVPLLFESKKPWTKIFDASIVVWTSPKINEKRLLRRGLTPEDLRARVAAQMPLEQKCCKADFILDNNRSRRELEAQVQKIHQACQIIHKDYKAGGTTTLEEESSSHDKRPGNKSNEYTDE